MQSRPPAPSPARAEPRHLVCARAGNHGSNFQIHVSSGLLMRGPRPLDRERNSSHVLVVEAYNHGLGPMRSSVRVRQAGLGADLRAGPGLPLDQRWPPVVAWWGRATTDLGAEGHWGLWVWGGNLSEILDLSSGSEPSCGRSLMQMPVPGMKAGSSP